MLFALQGSTLETEHLSPKMAEEDLVPIGNDGSWESMEPDNLLDKSSCDRLGRKRVAKMNEMGILAQPIHHHKDCIIPL